MYCRDAFPPSLYSVLITGTACGYSVGKRGLRKEILCSRPLQSGGRCVKFSDI